MMVFMHLKNTGISTLIAALIVFSSASSVLSQNTGPGQPDNPGTIKETRQSERVKTPETRPLEVRQEKKEMQTELKQEKKHSKGK